jgi:hypothetical protein
MSRATPPASLWPALPQEGKERASPRLLCWRLVRSSPRPSLLAAALLALAACGSGAADTSVGPQGVDASAPDPAPAGDAAIPPDAAPPGSAPGASQEASIARYPAFSPDVPQLTNKGGAILSAPKIVTVVWTADPNYAAYEALGDAIGASAYWKAAVSEYGVGPASSGGHVEITTPPPASFAVDPANDQIDAFVVSGVQGAPGNGWPAADSQTLYLVYIPESVAILQGGRDACANNVGYHTETTVGANRHVVYGVVAEKCHDFLANIIDNTTETASHEIGEAATDPHTNTDLALTGFDTDHYVWEIFQQRQDENGDACEFFDDAYYKDVALNATLQRLWSNSAARAGHNPCAPAPTDVAYFNVTPLAQERITTLGTTSKSHVSRGFHIPVGSTKTVDFGGFSDAPTEAWSIAVREGDGFSTPATQHLTLAFDRPTVNNGDIARLTVSVTTAPSKGNQILFTVLSTRNKVTHYTPILIGAYP